MSLFSKIKIPSTIITFFFERNEVIVDSTYLRNDIPKAKVTTKLDNSQVYKLFGAIDAVLLGNQKSGSVDIVDNGTAIIFQTNDNKSNSVTKYYLLRVTNSAKSRFTQLSTEASTFHSLREYLRIVLNRMPWGRIWNELF